MLFTTALAIVLAAGPIVAQDAQKQKPSWRTANDDIVIENIDSQSIQSTPSQIKVEFTGSPLRGRSRQQGLTFTTSALNGLLKQNTSKAFYLDDGRLSGNVNLTLNAQSGEVFTLKSNLVALKENAAQTQSTVTVPGSVTVTSSLGRTLTAGSAEVHLETVSSDNNAKVRELRDFNLKGNYRLETFRTVEGAKETYVATGTSAVIESLEATGKITSPGKLDINVTSVATGNDKSKNQSLSLQSSGGTISLPKSTTGTRPIESANLQGRITVIANTWFRETDDAGKATLTPVTITTKGDGLTLDANGVMTLRGNVTIDVKDVLTGSGDVLIVKFDKDMNVLSWETRGGPGTLQGAGGGGTKRR